MNENLDQVPDPGAIRRLALAAVTGDFQYLAQHSAGRLTAEMLREAVLDYGHPLSPILSDDIGRVDVYESRVDPDVHWVVEVTLRDDDGFNDLTLSVEVTKTASGEVTTRVADFHVL